MWSMILEKLTENPSSLLFDEYTVLTYEQVRMNVEKKSEILKQYLEPRSKCGILCKRGINSTLAIFACWCANMIPVPMSMNYEMDHCQKIIELIQPMLVITDNDGTRYPFQYHIHSNKFMGQGEPFTSEEALKDVALIMCTSGTTGHPKGAMITSTGLQKNVLSISQYFRITNQDRIMIARPLYHCAVLTGELLTGLYRGCDIGFFDDKYQPNGVLEFAVKHRISVLGATPTLFYHLSLFIERKQLQHYIKKIAISGECFNRNVAAVIRKGFIDADIYSVYGMTEASPRISYLPPEQFDNYPESVGIPINGVQIKIVDDDDYEMKTGEHGHIIVNTPSVMKGYYRNIKGTKNHIKDGWLYTGDIGKIDENNYLYILSRKDDMIIKGGINIYPKEIENKIIFLEPIQECMVYGLDSWAGQIIKVEIVLKQEYKGMSKKKLAVMLASILPQYQMPSKMDIVESLPKNASGKVIRIRKND